MTAAIGCKHVLRAPGLARHGVRFDCRDEPSHDLLMNGVRPVCGHGVSGKCHRHPQEVE
jgi:hypothetical protein